MFTVPPDETPEQPRYLRVGTRFDHLRDLLSLEEGRTLSLSAVIEPPWSRAARICHPPIRQPADHPDA